MIPLARIAAAGSSREIGTAFGIDPAYVRAIRRGTAWKHTV